MQTRLSLKWGAPTPVSLFLGVFTLVIADNLHNAGWSLGWVSAVDSQGLTMWIVDAHRGEGTRFVVRADEILTTFLELESMIRACGKLA